ncbi:PhzF family phenazine biosynthesis protein [Sphingomonas montanisoli]|uniref:PhzF family phenazine biosynthesis protein n=1 Tax=Sphingomonas montanisoli TaxID=2606412 RepID=A0A5D9CBY8_9SPHN|nr:PhzF family phenazine biosynthesis protein [Sphingomonas montanisoli]TZG28827.1 PhzF family phenazine biosynthesis protein [Sphingomonas montanisoli]
MTTLPFHQVDAFADRPFVGNPAAVMPLDAWLPDETLQRIAEENNLAETAFLVPDTSSEADYELRWFTPAVEVALCGHATLASGHVLLSADPVLDKVRFRTRKSGLLEVARAETGYRLALPAWKVEPKPLPVPLLGGIGGAPVETLWRDGGYALLVYNSEKDIRALDPDFRALKPLGDLLLIATAPGDDTDIVSRAFAPGAGIDEDPVTGSAHCLLTPYWAARLGRDSFTAFQASARGGHLRCTLKGDWAILEGQCVTVIEGRFRLD